MLKHCLESHRGEDISAVQFGMQAIRFHHSAFERQVHESVVIQSMRSEHNILNSRSEFNRCALPRLGVKMGDREFKAKKEEEEEEKRQEEEIENMIKELRKRKKNGERVMDDLGMSEPALKRRKKEETNQKLEKEHTDKNDIRNFFERLRRQDSKPESGWAECGLSEQGLSVTHEPGLSVTHEQGLSVTHEPGLSVTHELGPGLSVTHKQGLSVTHERGLSVTHGEDEQELSVAHEQGLSGSWLSETLELEPGLSDGGETRGTEMCECPTRGESYQENEIDIRAVPLVCGRISF
jgi:hypothetical protein